MSSTSCLVAHRLIRFQSPFRKNFFPVVSKVDTLSSINSLIEVELIQLINFPFPSFLVKSILIVVYVSGTRVYPPSFRLDSYTFFRSRKSVFSHCPCETTLLRKSLLKGLVGWILVLEYDVGKKNGRCEGLEEVGQETRREVLTSKPDVVIRGK